MECGKRRVKIVEHVRDFVATDQTIDKNYITQISRQIPKHHRTTFMESFRYRQEAMFQPQERT